MFTKYGYTTIGIVILLAFILIASAIISNNNYIKYSLFIIAIALTIFTLYFFRDPDRTRPKSKSVIVSPADGEILKITDVFNEYIGDNVTQLSIFMSPFNVHVNRIPIDGVVDYLKYHKGEYLMAFYDKADERNERMEIGIKSDYGKVLFTQIAGFVARRIVCDLKIGEKVNISERFGMIKFGSRVDVYAPKDWTVQAEAGQKVTAGETILFNYEK